MKNYCIAHVNKFNGLHYSEVAAMSQIIVLSISAFQAGAYKMEEPVCVKMLVVFSSLSKLFTTRTK